VGVSLHNHPVLPLVVPLAGGERGDVRNRRLAPALEVLGSQVVWAPPGGSQREEEPKQTHRWPHAHVHFTEVDEDRHQHEGVRCQVMKLEVVVL
jgi:hypothetical protein